jgi:hypothetical protein
VCARWSLSAANASLWSGDKQLSSEEAVMWRGGPLVFDLHVVKKDVLAEAVLVKKDLLADADKFVRPENEHFLFGADLHNQIMAGAIDVFIYMHKDDLNSITQFKRSAVVCSNADHNCSSPKRKNVFNAFFYVGGKAVQTEIFLRPRTRDKCKKDCAHPKYKCVRVTEKDVEPARLSVQRSAWTIQRQMPMTLLTLLTMRTTMMLTRLQKLLLLLLSLRSMILFCSCC